MTVDSISAAPAHRFAHHAMATVFEVVIVHEDFGYAEQCAHEAFRDVDRLELALSRFIENSDVSRINSAPVDTPVRVGVDAFDCLEHCASLYDETNGACDVTIGALLDCWSRSGPTDGAPSEEQLAELRGGIGMRHVELDRTRHTVCRRSAHVGVDLGGYGKGYAVDRIAEVLRDWDIEAALIHGGTSSVSALDPPAGKRGWQVTVSEPGNAARIVERLHLRNRAMSGSGLQKGRHIIDPRTARLAAAARAAWAITGTAAEGDALSTALMIMTPEEIRSYREQHPDSRAIVMTAHPSGAPDVAYYGDVDVLR